MIKKTRVAPLVLVALLLTLGGIALTAEILQHLSLTRWAQLLQLVGLDPTNTLVVTVRDLVRFQGSDFFGAAGYLVWAQLRSEEVPLWTSARAIIGALLALELLQMLLRGASFDWMDALAYALGLLLSMTLLTVFSRARTQNAGR